MVADWNVVHVPGPGNPTHSLRVAFSKQESSKNDLIIVEQEENINDKKWNKNNPGLNLCNLS